MPPPAALGRLKGAATTTTPTPTPFAFVYFLLLWGRATGRTGGAPPRLPSVQHADRSLWGRATGRTGAREGENKLRAVRSTADHGGPRAGASAKECTRQRDERGGTGRPPWPRGAGARTGSAPASAGRWSGVAATVRVPVWGRMLGAPQARKGCGEYLAWHDRSGAEMMPQGVERGRCRLP